MSPDAYSQQEGWIGSWSPGIGDPSWVGWLTVLLYFAAALNAAEVLRAMAPFLPRRELWFWRSLVLVLVVLGINKQLDLQTALTEMGRILAQGQGWHENRRTVQRSLIIGMALVTLIVAGTLIAALRRAPSWTKLTLLGALGLALFVVVRASSFHRIDSLLGTSPLGLRWNWILEVGGLTIILLGTTLRRMTPSPSKDGTLRNSSRTAR